MVHLERLFEDEHPDQEQEDSPQDAPVNPPPEKERPDKP